MVQLQLLLLSLNHFVLSFLPPFTCGLVRKRQAQRQKRGEGTGDGPGGRTAQETHKPAETNQNSETRIIGGDHIYIYIYTYIFIYIPSKGHIYYLSSIYSYILT